jgi:cobyrinic acid a,c-diamide synthase
MAFVIAGERSGTGKTTVTLALLAALKQRSNRVQSFKVGPDYIDPMFHHYVTGLPCRNLDPVLTNEGYVQQCFNAHSTVAEYSLIEGVMGLFDGAGGTSDYASTAHIARLLDLPVVLVLDCSRLSRSVAALAHGYKTFDPRINFAGVVLNRVGSDRHLELLSSALEPLHLPILGVLRRQDDITIPDRHLGLIPSGELQNLNAVIDQLAELAKTSFDWERLLPLLENKCVDAIPTEKLESKIRIAIARDSAFNFYYPDNLDILENLGTELVDWSPLEDTVPENIQGLYFGGGFPEVFAEELASNHQALLAVRKAIQAGIPTYAECGGLMYLCEQIVDFSQKSYQMVGIIPSTATMGKRLTLGYRQATAMQDSPMMESNSQVWGHEFHRSSLVTESEKPLFYMQGYDSKQPKKSEGWQIHQAHASYLHVHFGGNLEIPTRFLQHCRLHDRHTSLVRF